MKIHFFGYSLDIMGSLQKYNAGLTAFDAKKEFQNISCGRLIFWSYQSQDRIRKAGGGLRPGSVTYKRYAMIKMRANGIKIRKLKDNAAPAGLSLVGAIDFLYGWSKTVAETLFVFMGNTSGVRFVLLTLHPRINPGVTHRKSLQDFTFVCK